MSKTPEEIFIEKALKMQCLFIGIKYSKKLVNKEGFYLNYSWSIREENRFRSWFIKEIRKDLKMSNSSAIVEWYLYSIAYCWTYRLPKNE